MPQTIRDVAALVRSKNAGPFWLTLDVMFNDDESYRRAKNSALVDAEAMAKLFSIPATDVKVFEHDIARAIKVSIPRPVSSGSAADSDVFGGQQYAPLLDLPLNCDDATDDD
jgi:uncharacterized protein DUF4387